MMMMMKKKLIIVIGLDGTCVLDQARDASKNDRSNYRKKHNICYAFAPFIFSSVFPLCFSPLVSFRRSEIVSTRQRARKVAGSAFSHNTNSTKHFRKDSKHKKRSPANSWTKTILNVFCLFCYSLPFTIIILTHFSLIPTIFHHSLRIPHQNAMSFVSRSPAQAAAQYSRIIMTRHWESERNSAIEHTPDALNLSTVSSSEKKSPTDPKCGDGGNSAGSFFSNNFIFYCRL